MRWRLVFCAPVLAGLAVSLSCGGSTTAGTPTTTPRGRQGNSATVPPPPPGFVQASPRPTLVPLTDDQRHRVEAIIRADPTIAEIVGDISYSVSDLGPIYKDTTSTGELRVGGAAEVLLSQPIPHIERDWPFISFRPYYTSWPPDARARYLPYTEGTGRQAVTNLKAMEVDVDLARGKVVAINLVGERYGQHVALVTPSATPQVSVGVSSDAQNIFSSDGRLAAILASRSYQGPLAVTSLSDSPYLHIAEEIFSFDAPQDIEADWPLIVDGDFGIGNYQTDTIHFLATGVRSVSAVLDLDRGELVSIKPSERSPGD